MCWIPDRDLADKGRSVVKCLSDWCDNQGSMFEKLAVSLFNHEVFPLRKQPRRYMGLRGERSQDPQKRHLFLVYSFDRCVVYLLGMPCEVQAANGSSSNT